jgi:peptidyl-prolyl cis-trans isomerase B (cyclophilin B)
MPGLILFITAAAGLTGGEPAELSVDGLYFGAHRAVPVTVSAEESSALTLVLMDADGLLKAPPVAVRPGHIDLGETMPAIWGLRHACYLQLLVEEQPVGSALVVQPMLSRLVPIVESRPGAGPRIVGWRPEGEPPPADRSPESPPSTEAPGPEAERPAHRRVFSGLRIYRERDVILHTSHGDIMLVMCPQEAPNTVWNFLELCKGGFYDGVIFHRVVPFDARTNEPFVIQGGDPTGTGEGGPGYWLPLEPSRLPHDFGVISMARDVDPDSAGSQFFICLSRAGTARLDGQYCSFGYAVDGAGTIQAIGAVELADLVRGRPISPPVIERTSLAPAPPRLPGRGRPDERVSKQPPPPPPAETQPARVPR